MLFSELASVFHSWSALRTQQLVERKEIGIAISTNYLWTEYEKLHHVLLVYLHELSEMVEEDGD